MDPLTRDGIMNIRMQNMLAEFRTIEFIFDALDALFTFIPRDEIVREPCEYGPHFLRVALHMYRLLGMMARSHESNAMAIKDLRGEHGKGLEKLSQQLGFPFKVAHVIQELFQSSSDPIREFPDRFFDKLWSLTIDIKHSRFPDLLSVLLIHGGNPVKFNQDKLIQVISNNFPKGLFDANALLGYKRGGNENVEAKESREFVESLVKLAARLCGGRHRMSTDFFLKASIATIGCEIL